jgi:hypothetical protein
METLIKNGDYINYLIDINKNTEICIEFKIYKVQGWECDEGNTPCEEDIELFIRGYIKWDGCSHFWFGEEENLGYLHLCGRSAIDGLKEVMDAVWKVAEEKIENWDAEVAK